MDDATLRQELDFLGIDEHNYKLVALLPLVQVAWADGTVQRAERDLIHRVAERRGFASGAGLDVLDGWLTSQPSAFYLQRGRRVLSGLLHRTDGPGADVDLALFRDVGAMCEGVAQAAGGLFGIGRVSAEERLVIAEVMAVLGIEPGRSWKDLEADLS